MRNAQGALKAGYLLPSAQSPTLEETAQVRGANRWWLVPQLKDARENGLKIEMESLMDFTSHLPTRTVADSQSEMTELILPNDTNTLGNLLGGRLMHFIDLVGAMAAYRHARSHVVTASMDHIDFIAPVHVGDLLILKSSVNRAFNTSMEVGVKVWVENTLAGMHRHVASAYLTFVAVDLQGRRVPVPKLQPETDEEQRHYQDAARRREERQRELERKRALKPEGALAGTVRPGSGRAGGAQSTS